MQKYILIYILCKHFLTYSMHISARLIKSLFITLFYFNAMNNLEKCLMRQKKKQIGSTVQNADVLWDKGLNFPTSICLISKHIQLITPSRALGTADHVRSLDD